MDRSELRTLSDADLEKRQHETHAAIKALAGRWRVDDPEGLKAAQAQVEAAEEALSRLRAEANSLPAARTAALDRGSAADVRKVNDRLQDIKTDVKIAEAIALDKQARLEEIMGAADGEIGTPGRRLLLERWDIEAEWRRRLNELAMPIRAAETSAGSAVYTAAELRRRRAALLSELEPLPVGAR